MPPTKRARTAAASASSSSSQPAAAAPKLTLSGGVPHHPSLVALWRDERLSDFAICAEGVEFKAHPGWRVAARVVLGESVKRESCGAYNFTREIPYGTMTPNRNVTRTLHHTQREASSHRQSGTCSPAIV